MLPHLGALLRKRWPSYFARQQAAAGRAVGQGLRHGRDWGRRVARLGIAGLHLLEHFLKSRRGQLRSGAPGALGPFLAFARAGFPHLHYHSEYEDPDA
jgi:hypothetical protein